MRALWLRPRRPLDGGELVQKRYRKFRRFKVGKRASNGPSESANVRPDLSDRSAPSAGGKGDGGNVRVRCSEDVNQKFAESESCRMSVDLRGSLAIHLEDLWE